MLPVLNYSAEIWGYTKSKEVERIHLKFCKRLLKVRSNTCTAVVYGELGRYPLYIHRYIQIIKYWLKIINSDNIILRCVYNQALADTEKGHLNWVSNVKRILNQYGFSFVFVNAATVNAKLFLPEFKNRIINCFNQEWVTSLDSPVLVLYKEFKLMCEYEYYLDIIPKSLRFYFCRLRLSNLTLRVQTGRYSRNRIVREERYCICCNTLDIEDEFHFVCICPCYNAIRSKYIKTYFCKRPSVYKFIELLKSKNKNDLVRVSLYVKEALSIRKAILNV